MTRPTTKPRRRQWQPPEAISTKTAEAIDPDNNSDMSIPSATSWKCLLCGTINGGSVPHCSECLAGMRPLAELIYTERLLWIALTRDATATHRWQELHDFGADDAGITRLVAALLDEQPFVLANEWVCWSVSKSGRGGTSIMVWFGERMPPQRNPDLSGAELVSTVRRIFQIGTEPAGGVREPMPETPKSNMASAIETLDVPVSQLRLFGFDVRDDAELDEAELRALGESLRDGQVQPLAVREVEGGDGYEVVAGGRRLRAAKLVGLRSLRCEVHRITDAAAVCLCETENAQRADVSPIARAKSWRNIQQQNNLTQEGLGRLLGVSQGEISVTVGLLDLPEAWQRHLMTRAITPSAAKPLLTWAKRRPQVLDKVAELLKLPGSRAKPPHRDLQAAPVSVRDLADTVRDAVKACTRSMYQASGNWTPPDAPLFSVTPARRKELDVQKLSNYSGPEARAWNVALWDQLQKDAKAKRKKEAKEKPQAQVVQRTEHVNEWQLKELVRTWQARLIAAKLTNEHQSHQSLALRIAIVSNLGTVGFCPVLGIKVNNDWDERLYAELATKGGRASYEVVEGYYGGLALEALKEALANTKGPRMFAEQLDGLLTMIGAELSIDFDAAWRPTQELLDCYPESKLKSFPGGKAAAKTAKGKAELIAALLANWQPGFIPPHVHKLLGCLAAKPATKKPRKGK